MRRSLICKAGLVLLAGLLLLGGCRKKTDDFLPEKKNDRIFTVIGD